jgi:hypothetical protein
MRVASKLAFVIALLLTTADAQNSFPALLADKPSAEHQAKVMLFGQFIGDWVFEGTEYREDGSRPKDKEEISFHWVLEGRAIQDVWLETERSDSDPRIHGTTLRFYEPKRDSWRNIWIESRLGVVTVLEGKRVADEIVLLGRSSDGAQIRWIFSDMKPNSFRWHAEKLSGKKWRTYEEVWVRRKP